jgi:hypothetical protein
VQRWAWATGMGPPNVTERGGVFDVKVVGGYIVYYVICGTALYSFDRRLYPQIVPAVLGIYGRLVASLAFLFPFFFIFLIVFFLFSVKHETHIDVHEGHRLIGGIYEISCVPKPYREDLPSDNGKIYI